MATSWRANAHVGVLLSAIALVLGVAPGAAHAGTFNVFGPEAFTRSTGAPVTVKRNFSVLDPSAKYYLSVYNGGLQDDTVMGEMVSSGVITLNGTVVVGTHNFNQNVAYVPVSVTLLASNELNVEVRGKPGGVLAIMIYGEDNTPPVITATVVPAPNAADWNKDSVTVTFQCTDATSGIKSCSAPVTVSAEGANQTVTGTATDNAGNTATVTVTLNIDKTVPGVSVGHQPSINGAGWANSDVTSTFICTDTLSGIETCPAPVVTSSEGANQVVSGMATDKAGNTVKTTVALNIDKSAPVISVANQPAPNAAGWINVDVTSAFTCADALSGIAQCPAPVVTTGDSANHVVSGTATDVAGNNASATTAFKLDKTAPIITAAVTPAPNAAGWSNVDLTIAYSCGDSLSGVTSCPAPVVVVTEGASQPIARSVSDAAGNSTSTTVNVNIDKTPPVFAIVSPVNFSTITQDPPVITLQFSDLSGVDTAAVSASAGGQSLQLNCNLTSTGGTCTPTAPLGGTSAAVAMSVHDRAGNYSAAAFSVSFDHDADGVADILDVYPNDPARTQLAAVTGVTATQSNTSIQVTWQALADTANTAGYKLFRDGGQINATLLTSTTYIDSDVMNGLAYRYTVQAVAKNGTDGALSDEAAVFLAYNNTPVTNLTAAREGANARVSWNLVPGVSLQLYRGTDGATPAAFKQLAAGTTTTLDTSALWNHAYGYQLATQMEFINTLTGLPLTITGSLSAIATVPALPPLGVTLSDVSIAADGIAEITINKTQTSVGVSGAYTQAIGAVNIAATSASNTVRATSNNGTFRLALPATPNAAWAINVTEQMLPDRGGSAQLRMIADTTAPTITINGGTQRSINADVITLSGTATDANSGIAQVSFVSDRYLGQSFGASLGAAGAFSGEVPLQFGTNLVKVRAVDSAGNMSEVLVTVMRTISLAPTLSIIAPNDGSVVNTDIITVQGVVYSQQAATQLRVVLGDRILFPASTAQPGVYTFSFANVKLVSGLNTLTVRVESPVANDQVTLHVTYQKATTAEAAKPTFEISSPRANAVLRDASVIVAGRVTWSTGVINVTVDGSSVALVGADNKDVTFKHTVDLSALNGASTITIVATDAQNSTATKQIPIVRDTLAPTIQITTPGISAAPTVNNVRELPFTLQGSVNDEHLAGFSINGNPVGLIPSATPNRFDFSVDLMLPIGADQVLTLRAQDAANNVTTQDLVLNADVPVTIEIIAPRDGSELTVSGAVQGCTSAAGAGCAGAAATTVLDVAARLTGFTAGQSVKVQTDAEAEQPAILQGDVATASLAVNATTGSHVITIHVYDSNGQRLSSQKSTIKLTNTDTLELSIARTEPDNSQQGVEPNAFIALYFNKPIDPSKLQVSVKETVHGQTYDLSAQSGANPMMDGDTSKLIEVHRDQELMTVGLAQFPGNTMIGVHATRDFAYNADVFVDVVYETKPLHRFTFKVRPLPTLLHGFAADSMRQPIAGLEVALPDLNRISITDTDGHFGVGFGEPAASALPGGRTRLVFNPNQSNPRYGTVQTWVNIEGGRLTSTSITAVPNLNPDVPYMSLASGQSQAVLAAGELNLNLSQAQLLFSNGKNRGDVHVQFTPIELVAYRSNAGIFPHWLYAFQPQGIAVTGSIAFSITLPKLNGSTQYIPGDGTPVLLVGADAKTQQLVGIGVGQIAAGKVNSVGTVQTPHLDYLGYMLVDPPEQAVLKRYLNHEIDMSQVLQEFSRLQQ